MRWAALQDCQLQARDTWTPHLDGAVVSDQRQPEQAEADAVARSAELAHYCALRALRALRTAQRQEALPLVVDTRALGAWVRIQSAGATDLLRGPETVQEEGWGLTTPP